ncbi:PilZ domain-containing protein [Erythrobacter sp.]|jgi:hypothetical protein|uniref:PilZ domain-containing protein n=1 Tax=Erythrobacter sp. TaxID=1042 RepID=UPI002E9A2B11|nr:PilZ domain-containing protein [Erythrobacter sp.]
MAAESARWMGDMEQAGIDRRLCEEAGAASWWDAQEDSRAIGDGASPVAGEDEARAAPRVTLLIRAAKLVTSSGEFVCVLRDVSQSGISIRLFHKLPAGDPIELHMPGGSIYELVTVWKKELEAGFEFAAEVDVDKLINEVGQFPKRGLRLGLVFPIGIATLTETCEGVVENLSQQGARFECDKLFAIDQTLRLSCPDKSIPFGEVRAKVRWRRNREYGVVFDDTLTLSDFARLAAQLQCPDLLC